ncbi:MAG: glycosyltransferase family 1 protein [Planctomycetota bacterium]|nr:MAG: glycosyltransferase family 1 protein [Planctomycetota bacterium]
MLRRASAVTVVSRELSEWAVRAGAVAERVHVIPNGADPAAYAGVDRQAAREELGLAGFVVGFVGSLKQWHGVDVLLEAFARLRAEHDDARLLVVGTGPEEEVLKKQATALGLNGTVRFTGAVPHEQVPTLVRAMDLAVAPFRRQEHFYFSPIKLFEYMMGGVCIAASNLGQIAEVLDDGRTGVLVEPDDPVALGGVLKRLYRDAEARAALGRNARAVALARHTWQQTAETLGRVLEACRRGGERAAKADSVSAAGGGC